MNPWSDLDHYGDDLFHVDCVIWSNYGVCSFICPTEGSKVPWKRSMKDSSSLSTTSIVYIFLYQTLDFFYNFNQQCSLSVCRISFVYFTDLCILFRRLVLCTLKGCLNNNKWAGHDELINFLRKRRKTKQKLIYDTPVACFPGEKDKRHA